MSIRNKDVIEKSFKHLENEGRITVVEVYNFKINDGRFEEVDQLQYLEAQECLRGFLEWKKVSYYSYTQAVTSLNKSKKMEEIFQEAKECLSEQFDIEYFFKTFRVTVLDTTIIKEVTKSEFEQSYFNRLIKLTMDRQDKKDYKEGLSFWKRFYLLNTLSLLKHLNVEGIENYWQQERALQGEKTDDYALEYTIQQFDERGKRNVFGIV